MTQQFKDGAGSGLSPDRSSAVWGDSDDGYGIAGTSDSGSGVYGAGETSAGVFGFSDGTSGFGVLGEGNYGTVGSGWDIGVYAENLHFEGPRRSAYLATKGLAGDFYGDVFVHGRITKSGGGFQIDHVLDPANKYLNHSFVESSEMKNVYDGTVVLNDRGEATVRLPAWFETLNKNFRYQLTSIGKAAPNLHVAREIKRNSFEIRGGTRKGKVCWQVSGVRRDPWANAQQIPVEQAKPKKERGRFLHPDLYGKPSDKSIEHVHYPEQSLLKRRLRHKRSR